MHSRVLLFATLLLLCACRKHHNDDGAPGCITRLVPLVTDTLLPRATIDSIDVLFRENNLPTDNLQFTSWYYVPFANRDSVHVVVANTFRNGLPVLYGLTIAYFGHDTLLNYFHGAQGLFNNDTSGHQSLATLRQDFIGRATELMNGVPGHIPINYADSCLTATLSYVPSSYLPIHGPVYADTMVVKVWVVQQIHGPFPIVYVQDDNGASCSPPPAYTVWP